MSGVDLLMGLRTPKLQVPERFEPTLPSRGWLINPFGGNPIWTLFVAPLPALLATILIFMDQQITAVIINRKEHKLKASRSPVKNTLNECVQGIEIGFVRVRAERLRLPLGLVRAGDSDLRVLGDGHSMVRSGHGPFHEPRQLTQDGVRVGGAGREASVPGRAGAARDAHRHLPHDRTVGADDSHAEAYPHARALRCLPLRK